ncbi:MAG: tRNA (adenosine(37)-N6)-threonylcarbamoyltransferase complex ATPase subunit type 1 TsaE [Sedimentisphaerales bacterium]|nr:tRNA (adenosine(37)-N6)-threonylcarbamoyltransferase complex ATPase subunit type 1 TsaE [Sedimentisphaerales bacterium]
MNSPASQDENVIVTDGPQGTIALGKRIGAALQGGEVFCLVGPLGSGKTHLVKGIADGAGVADEDLVSSPTFVLINEYATTSGLELYHLDAYRLESIRQFEMLGFDDLCHSHSVVLIEWADKIASAIKSVPSIMVMLSHIDSTKRQIQISHLPPHLHHVLMSL